MGREEEGGVGCRQLITVCYRQRCHSQKHGGMTRAHWSLIEQVLFSLALLLGCPGLLAQEQSAKHMTTRKPVEVGDRKKRPQTALGT